MKKKTTPAKKTRTARPKSKGGRAPSTCSAWLARDSTPISGLYAMCLFEGKPEISNAGFWADPKSKYGGRWPITLPIFVNIGDRLKVTITKTPNAQAQTPRKEDYEKT